MFHSLADISLVGILFAATSLAGPIAVRSPPVGLGGVLGGVSNVNLVAGLAAVVDTGADLGIQLGSFDMGCSKKDELLFNIGAGVSAGVEAGVAVSGELGIGVAVGADVGVAAGVELEIGCVDCRTWGTCSVSTAGVSKNETLLGDITTFFESPLDLIVEAIDIGVRIDFVGVGGHFDLSILSIGANAFSFPLLETQVVAGIACSADVTLGLALAIDLVFSLSADIDLEAGFEFSFPEGAYITVNPLTGDIINQGFVGGIVNHLPIICTSGAATFEAAVRARIQAGTSIDLFGTTFEFELGVYADLIGYAAVIVEDDQCGLSISQSADVSIGAYALAVANIDYASFCATPAVVVKVCENALVGLCQPYGGHVPTFPTNPTWTSTSASGSQSGGTYPTPSISVPTFSGPSGNYSLTTGSVTSTGGVYPPLSLSVPTVSSSSSASSTGSGSGSSTASTPTISGSGSLSVPTPSTTYSTSCDTEGGSTQTTPILSTTETTSETTSSTASTAYYTSCDTEGLSTGTTTSLPAGETGSGSTPIGFPPNSGSPIASTGVTLIPVPSSSEGGYVSSSATYPGGYPSGSGITALPSTITSSAVLTTSTVVSTSLITITACASAVLHCPANATSEIVITSTATLYTTICPVGETQPTPSASVPSTVTASVSVPFSKGISSGVPLTTQSTTIVSTIYNPTFPVPTYTKPTATSFPVANPGFSSSTTLTGFPTSLPAVQSTTPPEVGGATTAGETTAAVVYPTPSGVVSSNVTTATGGVPVAAKPSTPSVFTGAAGRVESGVVLTMLLAVGLCALL